ncbi:hypothetical protein Vadar_001592 [Vaccinium darrowii]|uniref:Uncharacterized protein n=1 Tax=Vaccinium darrowii TaxID=229202 RepID=A0ACB7WXA5_9ERIC|nr:hypothetical protein Vadar_001592 [Vaccinium darrowii]
MLTQSRALGSILSSKVGSDDDDYTHQRLLLNSSPSRTTTGLKTCSLETLDSVLEYQLWEYTVDLDYPFNDLLQFFVIWGSCNGLVCVASDVEAIYLLNPSTRKSKLLPDSGVKRRSVSVCAYGFGFDESNDDYKVVLIVPYHGMGDSVETKAMVYTLKTDSWRQIKGFSSGIPFRKFGKLVNGSLHWVVRDIIDSRYSFSIVSLHLGKETCSEVLQPNYGYALVQLELCVLKRCLGLLCGSPTNYTDVWIMKEYGMIDSWTKLFTIQDVTEPWFRQFSSPLCISKNEATPMTAVQERSDVDGFLGLSSEQQFVLGGS